MEFENQPGSSSKKLVVAGSPEKLASYLTSMSQQGNSSHPLVSICIYPTLTLESLFTYPLTYIPIDDEFVKDFLFTFPQFMKPPDLFYMLKDRYDNISTILEDYYNYSHNDTLI